MIDPLESLSIQDKVYAKAFGVSEEDTKRISLVNLKNEMHTKAFRMRERGETLTQEDADKLNEKLNHIISELMELGYDPMEDYIIDFDNFVKESPHYNLFGW